MKIIRINSINSKEEYTVLPAYAKINGIYGYIVVTSCLRILHFHGDEYDDLSDEFQICFDEI